MERWQGKVCVVTGASAGIGAAVSVALADAGLRVIGFARRTNLVDDLKSEVKGKGSICSRECDVSRAESVSAAFRWVEETFGGVDVLVNNAGTWREGQVLDMGKYALSDEEILATINTNVTGLILCTRYAVASMKRRNFDGHVININSVAGHYVPATTEMNVYPASKHAVTAFGSTLVNELARFGSKIKNTSISPGLVKTALADCLIEQLKLPYLQPSDIAAAALYALSTPPNINITELTLTPMGQTIV